MKYAVIIPTFNRPAMLHVTATALLRCPEIADACILYAVDNHINEPQCAKTVEVIESLKRDQDRVIWTPPHIYPGNSYNVLNAYRAAALREPEFIFCVEDDVLVGEDFMEWSIAAHQTGTYFATVAARNTNGTHGIRACDDPGLLYGSRQDYSSLGACFPLVSVWQFLQHAHRDYFNGMVSYCREHFQRSNINPSHSEQDGLIRRVMQSKGIVAWPYVPRCYHFGWISYHRPGRMPSDDFDVQVNFIRELLDNPEQLRKLAGNVSDIDPCDLSRKLAGRLWCDQIHP